MAYDSSFDDSQETDPLRKEDLDDLTEGKRQRKAWPWTHWVIAGLSVVTVIETAALLFLASRSHLEDPTLELYSPANEMVRYRMVTNNAEHNSPYVAGEPADLDERWLGLYDFGMIGLTLSEKDRLSDATPPTPKDPDTYPVMIQVFHNIHCLNNLRQAIWRDDYPFTLERLPDGRVNRTTNGALHLDHCIDSLREALMCASDITPISFEVKGEDHHVAPKLSTTHVCRDFDALKEWAKTRQIDAWKLETGPAADDEAMGSFGSEDHHDH